MSSKIKCSFSFLFFSAYIFQKHVSDPKAWLQPSRILLKKYPLVMSSEDLWAILLNIPPVNKYLCEMSTKSSMKDDAGTEK